MSPTQRPTVPAPADDPLSELDEEVMAVSLRTGSLAWAAAHVASEHNPEAASHLARTLYERAQWRAA